MLALPVAAFTQLMRSRLTAMAGRKVLRYAFRVAETGFDPAQVNDFYSSSINGNIFDAPLAYDFRAAAKIVLNTAEAMPETSQRLHDDHGSHPPRHLLSDHPAFKGQKRELTAQDYVYSIKRSTTRSSRVRTYVA